MTILTQTIVPVTTAGAVPRMVAFDQLPELRDITDSQTPTRLVLSDGQVWECRWHPLAIPADHGYAIRNGFWTNGSNTHPVVAIFDPAGQLVFLQTT